MSVDWSSSGHLARKNMEQSYGTEPIAEDLAGSYHSAAAGHASIKTEQSGLSSSYEDTGSVAASRAV